MSNNFCRPVWIGVDRPNYIVSKVTPKRIYLRRENGKKEIAYSRETRRSAYDGKIDVELTLSNMASL